MSYFKEKFQNIIDEPEITDSSEYEEYEPENLNELQEQDKKWNKFIFSLPEFIKKGNIKEVSIKIAKILLQYDPVQSDYSIAKDTDTFNKHFKYYKKNDEWWIEMPIEK